MQHISRALGAFKNVKHAQTPHNVLSSLHGSIGNGGEVEVKFLPATTVVEAIDGSLELEAEVAVTAAEYDSTLPTLVSGTALVVIDAADVDVSA